MGAMGIFKRINGFFGTMILALIFFLVMQSIISAGIIDSFYTNMVITIGINIIVAVSLHLILGITGQFSIGQAGFLAVGAFISAIMTMKMGLPFLASILIGGLMAAAVGMLIGIPSLRLKGDYLAIATLGFGAIVRIIFLNMDYVGGASGMMVTHKTTWGWIFLWMMITILVVRNFTNSTHGRACISIREDETASDAMGINTTYYKVAAFVIGAFFTGIAGALYSHNFYFIQPANFNFLKSFDILILVVLGGLGSLSGTVISAVLLTLVTTFLSDYPETRMLLYSLVLIVMMIYRPQGLLGTKEITSLWTRKTKGGPKDGNQQTIA